ncbi:MAG: LysM domain-containing protein [Lachnoclostridium sp.]|jgi:hypothetical protein
MDNSYSKGEMTNNQLKAEKSVPVKMPKNLRQVGSVGSRSKVIYIEDYVMTYIRQLSDKEYSGCRVAVLLGYYVKTENSKNIFVKGAVEMTNTDFSNGIVLSDEGWTSVFENIKKYFGDTEIVGWSLIGPGFFIESDEKIRKVHMENFQGKDKILLKLDSIEKEESFYICENNHLVQQTGYYIYYDKNEEMQSYMVDTKEGVSEESGYSDHTTQKIRHVIQEKKDRKDDRSVIRLLYAASTLLAIIVLVIAATILDNYDKMRSMETALNNISQSLKLNQQNTDETDTGKPDISQQEDNTKEDNTDTGGASDSEADVDADNKASDMESNNGNADKVEIETVKGDVTASPENNAAPEESEDMEKSNEENSKSSSESGGNRNNNETAPEVNKDNNSADDSNDKAEKANDMAVETSNSVKYYIVQPGDSLAAISFQLYHTFSYMDEIKELNGIEDEDKIYVGQKLIVP